MFSKHFNCGSSNDTFILQFKHWVETLHRKDSKHGITHTFKKLNGVKCSLSFLTEKKGVES